MKKTIDLILFDLDGTLIDSRKDLLNAVNAALESVNQPHKTLEEITFMIGNGTWALVQKALLSDPMLVEKAYPVFTQHYGEHLLDFTVLYDGVVKTLEIFAQKSMAVVSNKRERFVNPILRGLQIDSYFQMVLGGDSLDKKKPDPAPILHVCKELGVPPRKTVLVGDSPEDIHAGKDAGVLTIGLTQGFTPEKKLKQTPADFLIPSVSYLPSILR